MAIPCLLNPSQSQFRIASIPPSVKDPKEALEFLFKTDTKLLSPADNRFDYFRISDYSETESYDHFSTTSIIEDSDDEQIHIFACNTPFIGNDNPDFIDPDPDEEELIEIERTKLLEKLVDLTHEYVAKYHHLPAFKKIATIVAGRISLSNDTQHLSSIKVDDSLNIFLPDLDNLQLRMPPLVRIIYILFLLHPEGIRLKEISNYRSTLISLYSIVKRHDQTSDDITNHINSLVDPIETWSLNQKITRSRNHIDSQIINPAIAKCYHISGNRGELYKINIPSHKVFLPDLLTNL